MSAELPGFAEALNRLVRAYQWVDAEGRVHHYSNLSLAGALRERGYECSDAYLLKLRNGARRNPSAVLLAGLCACFGGLDVRYFYDESVRVSILRDLEAEMEAPTRRGRPR